MAELDKFIQIPLGHEKERVNIDLHDLTKTFSPESLGVTKSKIVDTSTATSTTSQIANPGGTGGMSGGGDPTGGGEGGTG